MIWNVVQIARPDFEHALATASLRNPSMHPGFKANYNASQSGASRPVGPVVLDVALAVSQRQFRPGSRVGSQEYRQIQRTSETFELCRHKVATHRMRISFSFRHVNTASARSISSCANGDF